MRRVKFTQNKYYHVFNRGVDKRIVFSNSKDFQRFLQSMKEFNNTQAIGSIHQNQFLKNKLSGSTTKDSKLVNFVCYCLNPNHYHFILEQLTDKGIERFMHKLSTGYTRFFNEKYKRSGSLFQGRFKATYINSDAYLLHLSAYINLNNKVHRLSGSTTKSSWNEYRGLSRNNFCKKDIILNYFSKENNYESFAIKSLKDIKERKNIEKILLE